MFIHHPLRDDIAHHTRPLIAFLAEKIQEDFGLTVKMALEKEAFAKFGNLTETSFGKHVSAIDNYRKRHHANIAKLMHRNTTYDPMEAFKVEDEQAKEIEFNPAPTSPLRAVERADAQTNRIEAFTEHYVDAVDNIANAPHYNESTRKEAQETAEALRSFTQHNNVKRISYIPYSDGYKAGLHVNFSLWNGNDNLFSNLVYSNAFAEYLDPLLSHVNRWDTIMIAPTPSCYERLQNSDVGTSEALYRKNDEDIDDRKRMEWRTPSNAARHDLSTLMMLTAIYAALSMQKEVVPTAEFSQESCSLSREKALRDFKTHSPTFEQLHKIVGMDQAMMQHVAALKTQVIKAADNLALDQPSLERQMVQHWR